MNHSPQFKVAVSSRHQEKCEFMGPPLSPVLLSVWITLFGVALLIGATLKETPVFWLNKGGYPVGLRDFLLVSFYPAALLYAMLVLLVGWRGWILTGRRNRSGKTLLLSFMLNCGLIMTLITVVTWNNVQNLVEGRPLHFHSSQGSPQNE